MATAKQETVGALVDKLWAKREARRELEEKAKALKAESDVIEATLMERLGKEGLEKATGTKAGVSISSNVVADVKDWDVFMAFVAKTKQFHLVQRRVSDPSYRELLELKKNVPGVVPFTVKRLNLRSLSSN